MLNPLLNMFDKGRAPSDIVVLLALLECLSGDDEVTKRITLLIRMFYAKLVPILRLILPSLACVVPYSRNVLTYLIKTNSGGETFLDFAANLIDSSS